MRSTAMQNNRFELIISTCQQYCDLWDANVLLLNRNWPDRNVPTYLVTDEATDRRFDGVEVICAGSGLQIPQRLAVALDAVTAEYVILLLEDYFLTQRIDSEKIHRALDFMDSHKADYLQLYPQPDDFLRRDGAVQIPEHPGIYIIDTSRGNYKVVLTPGIWRKDFLQATLKEEQNIWEYEVSLTAAAHQAGALCATSNRNELPYLDVIRKGKLLGKAARYFRRHSFFHCQRQVMHPLAEWALDFRTVLKFRLPPRVFRCLKSLMVTLGFKFYSPVA